MPPYVSQGSILRLRDLDIPRGVLLEFMLRRRGSLDVDFAWSDGALDALRQMRGLQGLDVAFLENAVRAVPGEGSFKGGRSVFLGAGVVLPASHLGSPARRPQPSAR